MWKFLNPENDVMTGIAKAADLVLLNLLWMALSMTVVGLGPATVSLYYAIVKCIRRDRGTAFAEFFHAFKESWKVSLIVGLIMLPFIVSAVFMDVPNLFLIFKEGLDPGAVWKILSIFKLIILISTGLYAFPLISRFQIKTFNALVLSFTLAFRNIFRTILMAAVIFVSLMAVNMAPFLLVVMPAAPLFVISFIMEPVLKKMLPKDNGTESPDTDQWYLE